MSRRGDILTASIELAVEECGECHVLFAFPTDHQRRALADHNIAFWCPRGHRLTYRGKSTEQKLREAEARETALRDQLHAAEAEAEANRAKLVQARYRFARGVCPCCNRSFPAVARHIATQHPEFDAGEVKVREKRYRCSCGRDFETPRGLAIHQGHARGDGWTNPKVHRWYRHLTEVGS